jgi:2-haloacid dehalogenase
MNRALSGIKLVVFDVFGTCVDWRGSIIREGTALNASRGWRVDWPGLVDAWRGAYVPNMQRVRQGDLPWMNLDQLHRMALDDLLPRFGAPIRMGEADKQHINTMWHRLTPWPDVRRGLRALKQHVTIGTMSNGNVALLTNMAKHGGLPWDMVFSAELVGKYKPDRETYLSAPKFMQVKPQETLLVAAHKDDLDGAARAGLGTCFVPRPKEYGRPAQYDAAYEKRFTLNVASFVELADAMR